MAIKPGVRFVSGVHAMSIAALVVNEVCIEFGVDCVVTCGVEQHTHPPSLHPIGHALDFRTRDLPASSKGLFAAAVKERLAEGFDVVLESDHMHVEYQP